MCIRDRLYGKYILGECGDSKYYTFDPSDPVETLALEPGLSFGVTSWGENAWGELYYGTESGRVYKVTRWVRASPLIDCDLNGTPDACDIARGFTRDDNHNGIPDTCEGACAADTNHDGSVNTEDIFAFLHLWFAQVGQSGDSLAADFNADEAVSADDIFAFLDRWFAHPGPC